MFTSQNMKLANQMRKNDSSLTWSECIKLAQKTIKVKSQLASGIVEIKFIKKSTGELRIAKATTQIEQSEKSGVERKENAFIIKFMDTDINEWRSCDVRTLTA